ncbi:hypothetical protein AB4M78_10320 [Staphylococcus pasteuri]
MFLIFSVLSQNGIKNGIKKSHAHKERG